MQQPPPLPAPAPVEIPYATPNLYAPTSEVGRLGSQIVMPIGGTFPPRCVKCNAAAVPGRSWRKTLYWHPSPYYLLVVIGVLLYVIVAMIVRKKVTVEAGLCELHANKRRTRVLIGWLLFLASIGAFVASWYYGIEKNNRGPIDYGVLALVGVLLILAAGIWAVAMTRVLYPRYIDKRIARLGGAGRLFLDSLPAVPRN